MFTRVTVSRAALMLAAGLCALEGVSALRIQAMEDDSLASEVVEEPSTAVAEIPEAAETDAAAEVEAQTSESEAETSESETEVAEVETSESETEAVEAEAETSGSESDDFDAEA